MSEIFFTELDLPSPDVQFVTGEGTATDRLSGMLAGLAPAIKRIGPDAVVVQGDTDTVLAGGVVAKKAGIRLVHVEAGLRSHDERMPEEWNRIVVDHLADFLFCPTEENRRTLTAEGVDPKRVYVVGNTICDALAQYLPIALERSDILDRLGLRPERFAVVTVHRRENLEDGLFLEGLMDSLEGMGEALQLPVMFPAHPRTRALMEQLDLGPKKNVRLTGPLGFLDFLRLEHGARIILTDSGGVQEEACILRRPCVTLRRSTEREETLRVGCNVLSGLAREELIGKVQTMLGKQIVWVNPYGEGDSAEKILSILDGRTD